MTELIAFFVGVVAGIAVALPWRPLIARRVCRLGDRAAMSRRLAALRHDLAEATGAQ